MDGKLREWYESGQIRKDIDYKDGKKRGQRLICWDNGRPKRIDTYENDQLVEGKCMNSDGVEITYDHYEKVPAFPVGMDQPIQYLVHETKYPKKARKRGIEGFVRVRFVVNKGGTISDISIVQSVDAELDEEALRGVKKMPKWRPGIIDGEAVRVLLLCPSISNWNSSF